MAGLFATTLVALFRAPVRGLALALALVLAVAVAAPFAFVGQAQAQAATETANYSISVTISNSFSLGSLGIAFGRISALASPTDQATLTIDAETGANTVANPAFARLRIVGFDFLLAGLFGWLAVSLAWAPDPNHGALIAVYGALLLALYAAARMVHPDAANTMIHGMALMAVTGSLVVPLVSGDMNLARGFETYRITWVEKIALPDGTYEDFEPDPEFIGASSLVPGSSELCLLAAGSMPGERGSKQACALPTKGPCRVPGLF